MEERWPGQESPRVTLILHPDRNPEQERRVFDPLPVVHQLSRDYPWEVVTAPESLLAVRELMTNHRFELKELLGDEGYEGWVNFPVPLTDDFAQAPNLSSGRGPRSSTVLRRTSDAGWMDQTVYWHTEEPLGSENLSKELFGVYRDGIRLSGLLPGNQADKISWLSRTVFSNTLPHPQSFVNLKFSRLPSPNISRTTLVSNYDTWGMPIRNAIKAHLAATEVQTALALSPEDRLYRLGWLLAVFPLTPQEFSEMVPETKKVCIWLVPPRDLQYRARHYSDGAVPEIPDALHDVIYDLAMKRRFQRGDNVDLEWEGPASIVPSSWPVYSIKEPESIAMREALACAGQWSRVVPELVQFLEPPKGALRPLYQMVGKLVDSPEEDGRMRLLSPPPQSRSPGSIRDRQFVDTLAAAITDPKQLNSLQILELASALGRPNPVAFAEPFNSFLAVHSRQGSRWNRNEGWIFNNGFDVGVAAVRCLAACTLAMFEKRLSYTATDEYQQLVPDFSFGAPQSSSLPPFVSSLFAFVEKEHLIEGFRAPAVQNERLTVPYLSADSTVPPSNEENVRWRNPGRCGRLIKQWPLQEKDVPSEVQ